MRSSKSLWVFLLSGLGCFFVVLGLTAYIWYVPAASEDKETVFVYIPPASSASRIAEILADAKLVRSKPFFLAYVRLTGAATQLRAGYYDLSPNWALVELVEVLRSPMTKSRLVKVTIPEGYSLRQIAETLDKKGITPRPVLLAYWQHQVFAEFGKTYPYLLEVPTASIEGYLFPDTYFFSYNTPPHVVTGAFLESFHKRIYALWEAALVQGVKPLNGGFHARLTMASLIEKEAVIRTEMPIISGVFFNRLAVGMPLATDPTIVYAMGETWRPQLLYKDLKIESPYNTYKYKGLPPTPIASPGTAAFLAALHPDTHAYLFFVALKEGGGRHVFSKTYREHLKAQGY